MEILTLRITVRDLVKITVAAARAKRSRSAFIREAVLAAIEQRRTGAVESRR